nr:hypothetical protein CFP56_31945 [Quercus suber]
MSLWHGSKVNVFRVHFSLGKEFTPQLDLWITDAINMGALHTLDINLSFGLHPYCEAYYGNHEKLYDFPSRLLTKEKFSTTDPNIDISKLKYLAIVDCERLRGININGAVELNEFFFAGKHEYCAFKNVPKLVNVSFNCNTDDDYDGVLDVLTKFGHPLPQLEILNLHGRTPYIVRSDVIPQAFKVFPNLKYLELAANSFDNDILWIAYLLKFLPLPEELHLVREDRKPWEICKPMEIQRWLSREIPKGVQLVIL